ncbi:hypothetical protein [Rhodobaculum claviforme]|uniref:Uncharacterized protein n=1 Tax=Rhodobaculum claviforme TaxID=1549854 RepID=A0A934WK10_9RHOB|nr:hypothetical protein [Rhodobaculum claviforme]MBK5928063.1 hypothetical protein [Rhodobaculum claviforme]
MPRRITSAILVGHLWLALACLPVAADDFPRLVPLETLLPSPTAPEAAAPLGVRAAMLERRAAALRARVLIDADTRRRMAALAAR